MLDFDDLKLIELDSEQLKKFMSESEELGSFEDAPVGQELYIPVAPDGEGSYVFFGPIDFSGKTNNENFEEWKKSVKSTWEPTHRMIAKKSDDPSKLWMYCRATSSIGPCDLIAVYPSIFVLMQNLILNNEDAQEYAEVVHEIIEHKDFQEAQNLCAELFNHSFFTGLVVGPIEYVSGIIPNSKGYAQV